MVAGAAETFDVSARKFHQVAVLILLALGYVAGPPLSIGILLLAGVVMLVGRFWWPADLFRQLAWRFLEPAGLLRRREVAEDHGTRRLARVVGGAVFLTAAGLIGLSANAIAWLLVALVGLLIFFDAAFDFCVLCFAVYQLERRRHAPSH